MRTWFLIGFLFGMGAIGGWFSGVWFGSNSAEPSQNIHQSNVNNTVARPTFEKHTEETVLDVPPLLVDYETVVEQLVNTHEPALFAQRLIDLIKAFPNSNLYQEQAYWQHLVSNTELVKSIYQAALLIENPLFRQMLLEQGTYRISNNQRKEIEQYLYEKLVSGTEYSKWLSLLVPMTGVGSARLTNFVLDRLPQYSSANDQSNAIEIGINAGYMGHFKPSPNKNSVFDELLTPYFSSPYEKVRASAMHSLRDSTRANREQLLIAGIFDESELVQVRSIDAARYRKTFTPIFIDEMKEILRDSRAGFMVRYTALETLIRMRPNQQDREFYKTIQEELQPQLDQYYLQRRESLTNY